MLSTSLYSMYRMVCNAPQSGGISVEHMPELIDQDPQTNLHAHTHAFYEILWFQEGGGLHSIDFREYPVRANSVFFLAPGQVHRFVGEERLQGYSIKICADFFETTDEQDLIRYSVFHSAGDAPYAMLDEQAAEIIGKVVRQMQKEQQSEEFGHQEMLRLLARILLIDVRRYAHREGETPLPDRAPAFRLFIRFRRMLEEEYIHLHSVQDYADRLDVSSKTLTNAVKMATGQTPLAFINDRIILEAKRLLRFSNLMVKEIAYHLGFDDPSNFVKFFKRQTGYLPGDFQKNE